MPQTTDLTKFLVGLAVRRTGACVMEGAESSGEPVRNAKVEIWQANARGRYTNPAPLDPNFDGSAVLDTDAEGRYRFTTIKPAAYPAGPNLIRPAHTSISK
jgi:protocatechuate 3,4-dioxygenase beta subunit